MAPARPPSNWDPALIISQIVVMQTLHYLTLSLLTPPLLALFAEPSSLAFEGGAASVGMVMDWRQMAGQPTGRADGWGSGAWSGGRKLSNTDESWDIGGKTGMWNVDPTRGWVIAFCWLATSLIDTYPLSTLIRRPRLILDFSLTLLFNHLVLTTYYSASVPSSIFFWLVMIIGAAIMVVLGEQVCVRREMREGLSVIGAESGEHRDAERGAEEMEMGAIRNNPRD